MPLAHAAPAAKDKASLPSGHQSDRQEMPIRSGPPIQDWVASNPGVDPAIHSKGRASFEHGLWADCLHPQKVIVLYRNGRPSAFTDSGHSNGSKVGRVTGWFRPEAAAGRCIRVSDLRSHRARSVTGRKRGPPTTEQRSRSHAEALTSRRSCPAVMDPGKKDPDAGCTCLGSPKPNRECPGSKRCRHHYRRRRRPSSFPRKECRSSL